MSRIVAWVIRVIKPEGCLYTWCPKAIWFGSRWPNTRYMGNSEPKKTSITVEEARADSNRGMGYSSN